MNLHPTSFLGVLLCLVACSAESPDDSPGSLIDHAAWDLAAPKEDPFWDEENGDQLIPCRKYDYESEGSSLEVSTEACNYITLEQNSLFAIAEGDVLELTLWWQTLVADPPATGHVAVQLGETMLFEEEIPIPSKADARSFETAAPGSFPEGTKVTFHVHNHGSNSWSLGSLNRLSTKRK